MSDACVCARMYVCMYVCTYAYMYVHIYLYTHTCTYTLIHTGLHMYSKYIYTHIHTCIHTYTHMYIYICMYMYVLCSVWTYVTVFTHMYQKARESLRQILSSPAAGSSNEGTAAENRMMQRSGDTIRSQHSRFFCTPDALTFRAVEHVFLHGGRDG